MPTPDKYDERLAALVKAAVRLAIIRHDLETDGGSCDEQLAIEVADDTWDALRGEGTCAGVPCEELVAARAAVAEAAVLLADREACISRLQAELAQAKTSRAWLQARDEMREACAKVAETYCSSAPPHDPIPPELNWCYCREAMDIAAIIRRLP